MGPLQQIVATFLIILLVIAGVVGFINLLAWKAAARKRIRREEEKAEAIRAAREMEDARLLAQKPYNTKVEAWLEARKAEGPAKQTYGEYGRLFGYPIDTEEEYETIKKSMYSTTIQTQPSRYGGAYEIMQQLQDVYTQYRAPCPRCFFMLTQTVGQASVYCPNCRTRTTGPR